MSTDPDAIFEHITLFYNRLFTEEESQRPLLDGLDLFMISDEDVVCLERSFDEDEVGGVVFGFKGDKAPGPDGFTMGFIQSYWEVVKADIMVVLKDFHGFYSFEKSLNATFGSLFPKKSKAMEVKDFRPISLVGGVYKILAKLLANRLRVVLPKIISNS